MAKKGYNYPIKKKIPLILLLNLFGIIIISHFLRFVNIFNAIYQITFREVEKSLPPGGRWHAERDGRSLRKLKFILTLL